MLSGKDLSKSYSGEEILKDINLDVKPGEISVIIGPSGSGKTTLLKLMSLLEKSDSGQIELDGVKYDFPMTKEEISPPPWPDLTVVFQQLFLWPHMTLMDNITLPAFLRDKEEKPEKVEELIELLDMKSFIHRYPNETSLGQRQRVALARALLLEPKYILLDEITSSLDVEQVAVILKHLQVLAKRGIGILTVTHLLHFAEAAADQIIFVDQGKVIDAGGAEVLTDPKHERIKQFLSVIESAR